MYASASAATSTTWPAIACRPASVSGAVTWTSLMSPDDAHGYSAILRRRLDDESDLERLLAGALMRVAPARRLPRACIEWLTLC